MKNKLIYDSVIRDSGNGGSVSELTFQSSMYMKTMPNEYHECE